MLKQLDARHVAWVGVAVLAVAYFVAGSAIVPFHGDESIWIYMSADFEDLGGGGDFSRLLYSDAPADPEDQGFRELNNPLAKYVIALSRRAGGYHPGDLNDYWLWGADWDWNAEHGRIPSAGLLRAARWLPAVFGALTVLATLALGLRLGGWWVAGLAALLLTLDASFLLHTRRAMAEGTLMGVGTLAVALAAAYLRRRASPHTVTARTQYAYLAGIGLLTGLAVATKLNGAIVAMTVAVAWVVLRREAIADAAVELSVVALIALAVVLALSPFLWRNPPARIRDTFRDMNTLVEEQRRGRESLDTAGERAGALIGQVFWTQRAYYEDDVWGEWVGDQITRYEASPLSGWRRPAWARVALGVAFLVGTVRLITQRPSDAAPDVTRRVVLLWLAVTAAVNLVIIPFDWQRYYLPLWPAVALVEAVGLVTIARTVRQRLS